MASNPTCQLICLLTTRSSSVEAVMALSHPHQLQTRTLAQAEATTMMLPTQWRSNPTTHGDSSPRLQEVSPHPAIFSTELTRQQPGRRTLARSQPLPSTRSEQQGTQRWLLKPVNWVPSRCLGMVPSRISEAAKRTKNLVSASSPLVDSLCSVPVRRRSSRSLVHSCSKCSKPFITRYFGRTTMISIVRRTSNK